MFCADWNASKAEKELLRYILAASGTMVLHPFTDLMTAGTTREQCSKHIRRFNYKGTAGSARMCHLLCNTTLRMHAGDMVVRRTGENTTTRAMQALAPILAVTSKTVKK